MQCSFVSPAQSTITVQGNDPRTVTPSDAALRSSTPTSSSSLHPESNPDEPYVNATHVELFYFILESDFWALRNEDLKATRPHVLKYFFMYPFLLDELLAVSALHLSTCRPAQRSLYRDEATRLQSHAQRLFNETIRDLNSQNIIPAFLFSALQGIATFFEIFHDPTYETSDWTFFEKVLQSVRLLQGIRAIVYGWWHFLITSDLKDILKEAVTLNLEWNDMVTNRFEEFRVQILQSPGLDQTHATVYDKAIEELVLVYKSAFGNGSECSPHDRAAIKHATQWLIVVPPAYTELLVQRKPEALVILGHFAIILHKLRACWMVGDAGQQLLLLVEAHLEETWHATLSWPKSFVKSD